jgi:hypothetical protein
MKYFYLILIFLININCYAVDCPEFETTLESLVKKIKASENFKVNEAKTKLLSSGPVSSYKAAHAEELTLAPNANRRFMELMAEDTVPSSKKVLYFDVENSVQKKLNDQIFGEKTMVDAVNNSFIKKFYQNVKNNPELSSKLKGEYKDYKSIRLRLELSPGDNPAKYEALLNDAYKKSVAEFADEIKKINIDPLIKTRTDDVANPERWFLAGVGEDALEANMAARGARTLPRTQAEAGNILKYKDHVDKLSSEILEIESLRKAIAGDSKLVSLKILEKLDNGALIPSKEMINILRKYKIGDFKNEDEYLMAISKKVKTIFGEDVPVESIRNLTQYQLKVDSISPPLFSRERTIIDLENARNGIVSIDFAGIGVDNLYQQMKALAGVNYNQIDKVKLLKETFTKVQSYVDNVTGEMNTAKRYFTKSIQEQNGAAAKPLFSGDDGIYMPKGSEWTSANKKQLVKDLASSSDPSKYRVTFVKTTYPDGTIIPADARSKLIVRAESLEKKVREEMVSVDRISYADSKKIITAIDFTPSKSGGSFNVLVSGKDLSLKEKSILEEVIKKSIKTNEGETFGGIIYL